MTDTLLTVADIEKEAWMGGQRDKVLALLAAYEKARAQLADERWFARPHDTECESLRPFPGSKRAPCNCAELEVGPGTTAARLEYFYEELEKRFPGVVNPNLSDPPEPKLLAAIDAVLAKNAEMKKALAECLIDLRSPFPAEASVIARLRMGESSIEKAEKALST